MIFQRFNYFFFYFLYSQFVMQNVSCNRHQSQRKRFKELVILEKYSHIQRQIKESSFRLFQKFHGKIEKHKSLNPFNNHSREKSREIMEIQTIDSKCEYQIQANSTLHHAKTNASILNSVREILKGDRSEKKFPLCLEKSYQMVVDEKRVNLEQPGLKAQKRKVRQTYNIFSKGNSTFHRPLRFSECIEPKEMEKPAVREITVRIKMSRLRSDKLMTIKNNAFVNATVPLVKPSQMVLNADQSRQPVKLKKNFSNMYHIYGLNHKKKTQNTMIEDDSFSTGRIDPWNDNNS